MQVTCGHKFWLKVFNIYLHLVVSDHKSFQCANNE